MEENWGRFPAQKTTASLSSLCRWSVRKNLPTNNETRGHSTSELHISPRRPLAIAVGVVAQPLDLRCYRYHKLCRMIRDAAVLAFGLVAGALLAPLAARKSIRAPPIRAPGVKAWRMSKWVKYGGIIRTQGICGDFDKMPSSTAQQTAEALAKIDDILNAAGITRAHLIAVTIFLKDMNTFEEMNGVYDKWVDPNGLPTRLCVEAKLGHNAAVEIRVEAWCAE